MTSLMQSRDSSVELVSGNNTVPANPPLTPHPPCGRIYSESALGQASRKRLENHGGRGQQRRNDATTDEPGERSVANARLRRVMAERLIVARGLSGYGQGEAAKVLGFGNQKIINCDVRKNRQGRVGSVILAFDGSHLAWHESTVPFEFKKPARRHYTEDV